MSPPVMKNHIAGKFLAADKQFENTNPVDGSLVAMVAEADREMVNNAAQTGRDTLRGDWGVFKHAKIVREWI